MESMQLPYGGVNMALAKDDVRSRSRLVVTYKCKQSRGLPIVITICSYLAQTHHNSIQINEVVGKLWCVHLLHLMTFTTSLHLLLTSSLANAVLTPYMGVAYSPLIYSAVCNNINCKNISLHVAIANWVQVALICLMSSKTFPVIKYKINKHNLHTM